jgi:hypothetical protein
MARETVSFAAGQCVSYQESFSWPAMGRRAPTMYNLLRSVLQLYSPERTRIKVACNASTRAQYVTFLHKSWQIIQKLINNYFSVQQMSLSS